MSGDLAISECIEALDQAKAGELSEAHRVLLRYGASAVMPLVGALGSASWRQRAHAAYLLGRLGDKRALDPLLEALARDRCWRVRSVTAWACGQMADCGVVAPLIEATHEPDFSVRTGATHALGALGDTGGREAIVALYHALRWDHELVVRLAAYSCLRTLGQEAPPIRLG